MGMRIGELSERSGVSASAIRYYESRGLLKSVPRKANGYREYPEDVLLLLNIITSAQQTGFSLDEIQQFLPPDPRQWNHEQLLSLLQAKIEDIEALEARLATNKRRLKRILQTIQDKPADMSCEANAEKVFKDHLT